MKKIFFVVAALGAPIIVNAQLKEKIIVRAGENIPNAISPNGYFRFPKFTEGILLMQDGRKSTAAFNYHFMTGEMLYITKQGDTMALGAPEEMDRVVIANNIQFIYNDKSYFEILSEGQSTRLAKKIKITMDNDKKGAYGQSAFNSSQEQIMNVSYGRRFYELSYDVAITKTTSLYWIDSKNNLQPATKKSSLKLVAKDKQPKLETFIEENKINFNSEDDLRKLLGFADTL